MSDKPAALIVGGAPVPPKLPVAAWINKPIDANKDATAHQFRTRSVSSDVRVQGV